MEEATLTAARLCSVLLLYAFVFVVIAIIGTASVVPRQKVHHLILIQILGAGIRFEVLVVIVKNAGFTIGGILLFRFHIGPPVCGSFEMEENASDIIIHVF